MQWVSWPVDMDRKSLTQTRMKHEVLEVSTKGILEGFVENVV